MTNGPQSTSDDAGSSRSGSDASADFSKLFGELKFPHLPDMEAVLAANRRNLEALSSANRIALEGAQAVARRNVEIMQQTMAELTEAVRTLASAQGTQAKAAKQTELLKQAYERAVGYTQELRELIQKSNTEALSLINKRFAEAMDELKALVEKAK